MAGKFNNGIDYEAQAQAAARSLFEQDEDPLGDGIPLRVNVGIVQGNYPLPPPDSLSVYTSVYSPPRPSNGLIGLYDDITLGGDGVPKGDYPDSGYPGEIEDHPGEIEDGPDTGADADRPIAVIDPSRPITGPGRHIIEEPPLPPTEDDPGPPTEKDPPNGPPEEPPTETPPRNPYDCECEINCGYFGIPGNIVVNPIFEEVPSNQPHHPKICKANLQPGKKFTAIPFWFWLVSSDDPVRDRLIVRATGEGSLADPLASTSALAGSGGGRHNDPDTIPDDIATSKEIDFGIQPCLLTKPLYVVASKPGATLVEVEFGGVVICSIMLMAFNPIGDCWCDASCTEPCEIVVKYTPLANTPSEHTTHVIEHSPELEVALRGSSDNLHLLFVASKMGFVNFWDVSAPIFPPPEEEPTTFIDLMECDNALSLELAPSYAAHKAAVQSGPLEEVWLSDTILVFIDGLLCREIPVLLFFYCSHSEVEGEAARLQAVASESAPVPTLRETTLDSVGLSRTIVTLSYRINYGWVWAPPSCCCAYLSENHVSINVLHENGPDLTPELEASRSAAMAILESIVRQKWRSEWSAPPVCTVSSSADSCKSVASNRSKSFSIEMVFGEEPKATCDLEEFRTEITSATVERAKQRIDAGIVSVKPARGSTNGLSYISVKSKGLRVRDWQMREPDCCCVWVTTGTVSIEVEVFQGSDIKSEVMQRATRAADLEVERRKAELLEFLSAVNCVQRPGITLEECNKLTFRDGFSDVFNTEPQFFGDGRPVDADPEEPEEPEEPAAQPEVPEVEPGTACHDVKLALVPLSARAVIDFELRTGSYRNGDLDPGDFARSLAHCNRFFGTTVLSLRNIGAVVFEQADDGTGPDRWLDCIASANGAPPNFVVDLFGEDQPQEILALLRQEGSGSHTACRLIRREFDSVGIVVSPLRSGTPFDSEVEPASTIEVQRAMARCNGLECAREGELCVPWTYLGEVDPQQLNSNSCRGVRLLRWRLDGSWGSWGLCQWRLEVWIELQLVDPSLRMEVGCECR